MVETPSAVNTLFNDSGEMPNSYSMVAAPMKFCATIWEGSTAKINCCLRFEDRGLRQHP